MGNGHAKRTNSCNQAFMKHYKVEEITYTSLHTHAP